MDSCYHFCKLHLVSSFDAKLLGTTAIARKKTMAQSGSVFATAYGEVYMNGPVWLLGFKLG